MKLSESMLATLQVLQGYKTTANGYSTNPRFFKLHYGSVQALIKRGLLEEDGTRYLDAESNALLYRISEAGQQALKKVQARS